MGKSIDSISTGAVPITNMDVRAADSTASEEVIRIGTGASRGYYPSKKTSFFKNIGIKDSTIITNILSGVDAEVEYFKDGHKTIFNNLWKAKFIYNKDGNLNTVYYKLEDGELLKRNYSQNPIEMKNKIK